MGHTWFLKILVKGKMDVKHVMFDRLLNSGAQPNLDMERPYVELDGDFSRLRPREYNIPEKSIMELFNPTVPHHQRPRS
ncbi:Uncharacterized protein FWK35_00002682 [Aphis craccivora]|uniref:Uncharacterized protein n=1 Tax=Aphis craccivora TaxID=307492 RepID=A0A6G0ZN61_APHCR|nr:Uncharacterized protein FWK35_00002682 [Aphis craccivora]